MPDRRRRLPKILGYEQPTLATRLPIDSRKSSPIERADAPCSTPEAKQATDADSVGSATAESHGRQRDRQRKREDDWFNRDTAGVWREYHDWDRTRSYEDARLAAERLGMYGQRAKDGTIKPVVSQKPKEEYL